MKKLLLILMLAGSCAAQRHPYNSRPYHPPDRQSMPRDARRAQTAPPPNVAVNKPQPVSVQAPKPEPLKRGK
jgi:hypothetical protein